MEYLKCDECEREYTDKASIDMAKRKEKQWRKSCEDDGDQARGIAPCPIITCRGELILKRR